MNTSNEIRVGLVGAGYVSTYHIRALQALPHVKIVGLADLDIDRAGQIAAQYGIPGVYRTLEEMGNAKPNVIHVLTPPASHCRLALEALRMGCHVFVEKPMALTVEQCDQMIHAAKRAGRVLSVNHSARMDPVLLQGLELIRKGVCGDVLAVDFFRGSDYPLYGGGPLPAPFRDGGYPFQDMGVHGLYLIEAFLGRIGRADIQYYSTGKNPHVFYDEWRTQVDCEKGTGQMYLSWSGRPMRNELYIQGTRGFLHIDCFLQTCTVHKSLPGPKAVGASATAFFHSLATLYKVPMNMLRFARGKLRPSPGIHAGVLQFYDALSRGIEPPVSVDEGRRMVALAETACLRANADRDRALELDAPIPPAKILVTGANGFLGRALVNRLRSEGKNVRVLVRRPSPSGNDEGVHAIYGDLGDPAAVERAVAGVDVVYHVGATMRGRGWNDFQAGTVCGTKNVVEACLGHGVKRLVYVSSLTVLDYATPMNGATVDEEAALEPCPEQRGGYTKSKLESERIVMDAVRDRKLPAVILRPGQIFGPGAETVPPYGTISLAGRWVVIGSGKLRLPLVYVDDVVDGLIAAGTRSNVVGATFHLVDNAAVTQDEYISSCRSALGLSLKVMHAPRLFLFAAGTMLEIIGRLLHRSVPLSRYRVRSIKELRFDCTAARDKLGWQPAIGVTAGFRETFEHGRVRSVATASG
jgi:predicted dehydrogenase/nucleoside-diphosphate-sugar epimerase